MFKQEVGHVFYHPDAWKSRVAQIYEGFRSEDCCGLPVVSSSHAGGQKKNLLGRISTVR